MHSQGKSFVADIVEGFGLMVQGKDALSDEEWDKVLGFYRHLVSINKTRVLVYTDGAAPTAAQRGKLQNMLGKVTMTFAVLTPSAWARAVGAAISWFIPNVGMFKPTELDKAFDHLEVLPGQRAALRTAVEQLRQAMERSQAKDLVG